MPCLIVPVGHGCKTPAPRAPRQTRLAVQVSPTARASRHAPRVRGRAQRNRSASVTSAGLKKLLKLGTEPYRHRLVFRCLSHLFQAFGLILWKADLHDHAVIFWRACLRGACSSFLENVRPSICAWYWHYVSGIGMAITCHCFSSAVRSPTRVPLSPFLLYAFVLSNQEVASNARVNGLQEGPRRCCSICS